MAFESMTEAKLFAETGDAYSSLIHLEEGVEETITRISACSDKTSNQLIHKLLRDGDSWRERLLGLALGTIRGIDQFYDSLMVSLHRSGGISIVPICAALAVAVRDRGCEYDARMTETLNRDLWDGEIGYALDWFHHAIGIGDAPEELIGPNYGQEFARHLAFYSMLNQP
jgi:hypothetical protein